MLLFGICVELIYYMKNTSIIIHIGISTVTTVQTHPNTSPSTDISRTGNCTYFNQNGQ
jgi:hypothetical protein